MPAAPTTGMAGILKQLYRQRNAPDGGAVAVNGWRSSKMRKTAAQLAQRRPVSTKEDLYCDEWPGAAA